MRTNAAESLGFFHDESKRSVSPLLERLSDNDIEVRRATILALGPSWQGKRHSSSESREILGRCRPDHQAGRHHCACQPRSSGRFHIPVLISALGNKDEGTAKAAGRVLSDVATKEPDKVLPGLVQVLDRREQSSLVYALRVLKRMKAHAAATLPKLAALYDEMKPVDRIEVIEALEVIDTQGDHAVPVLAKALKDSDPQNRKDALLAS